MVLASSDIDFITHNDITDEQRYDHLNKPVLPEHFDAKHTSATAQSSVVELPDKSSIQIEPFEIKSRKQKISHAVAVFEIE